jgi:hypothetical protein
MSGNPKFTQMEIVFRTVNDDKDSDTRLEIFIVPKIGQPAVAYLDIGGGNQPHVPNEHFPDNSTSHPFTRAEPYSISFQYHSHRLAHYLSAVAVS